MGCLTWPFKALAVVLLAALVAGAWWYRDTLVGIGKSLVHWAPPSPSTGRPGVRALAAAHDKIDSLNAWDADSVVLSASETASLVGEGLDPGFRGNLDSLQVELREDTIAVRARLHTAGLPRQALGPLVFVVQPWEPFAAAGPLRVTGAGRAEWEVAELSIREIPFPWEMIRWLVGTALGGGSTGGRGAGNGGEGGSGFPLRIPAGITNVAVHPHGLILYGGGTR